MNYYIGVDLGTSSMKLILLDEEGQIRKTVSKTYPSAFPRPGWSEQNPEDWRGALMEGIPELLGDLESGQVVGLGCGGQMHGLVILDEKDQVIRPAILWNDGRTTKQTEALNDGIGRKKLEEWTANVAFAGFTAPKLLWLKEEEPEHYGRIAKIMLPKDYINYILTGVHACDYSDASGTLLLDVKNKCWSPQMLKACGVRESQLPRLWESFQCIGTVQPEIARVLGLPQGVKVAAGAGDNAAAAIGTGIIGDGGCNISLGTSGTVFVSSKAFPANPNPAIHTFAHADGGYHLLGCMLSAASCNRWFMEDILRTEDYASEQLAIAEKRLGKNPVYFLPYLMGERSPIEDMNARGTFIGMRMDTTRADLVQAVLEGVAFAIRDNLEAVKRTGIVLESSRICGGGAKSVLWRRILANVLNIPLQCLQSEQGPALGGAMLAMAACDEGVSSEEICRKCVRTGETILPEPWLAEAYEDRYQRFQKIYPACRNLFTELA